MPEPTPPPEPLPFRSDHFLPDIHAALEPVPNPTRGKIVQTIFTHYISSLQDTTLTGVGDLITTELLARRERGITRESPDPEQNIIGMSAAEAVNKIKVIFDTRYFRDNINHINEGVSAFVADQLGQIPDDILQNMQERIEFEQINRNYPPSL
jgi:hypothetical protein